MKKQLKDLTLEEHSTLSKMGFLWEFYPESTGNWSKDTGKIPEFKDKARDLFNEGIEIMEMFVDNKYAKSPVGSRDKLFLIQKFKQRVESLFVVSEPD